MAGESELRRTFHLLGSLALVGALLYWGRPVIIPVAIAVLATFILAPIAARLERLGVPRFLAATSILLVAAVLLVAIGYAFIQQVSNLGSEIPTYKTQISEKIGSLRNATGDFGVVGLIDFANDVSKNPATEELSPKDDTIAAKIEIPVVAVVQSVAGTAVEILLNAVIVLILALLMLMRREDLRNRVIQLLGAANRVIATRALDDASKRVSRFLLFQLIINFGFGTAIAVGLFLIGIPYPYVWGALAALLRYIPFLGGWIAAAFPLLASLVMPTWMPFFLTAGFFLVMELLQAYLVEPLVFGHSIGVSGPGQVIAMLVWALLWGPVGLILSTPMTACLCVLGHHFPGLRFFSILMGDGEIVAKPEAFYQRLLAGDSAEASILAEGFLSDKSITAVADEMFVPALLAARSDHRNGELTKEELLSITDGVRDVFLDLVGANEDNQAPLEANRDRMTNILRMEFPFNDEIDDLVMEMLKSGVTSANVAWETEAIGDGILDQIPQREDYQPDLIIISTSAKKNLARIRGACKTVRKIFPDAVMLVCCWCLESEADANGLRLKEAGASVVCTSLFSAQTLIAAAAERAPQFRPALAN